MIKKKTVIDTNLWISFLISKNSFPIEFLFLSNKIELLFSNNLLEEFINVASWDKFRNYFPVDDILNLSLLLHKHSNFIEVSTDIKICRDEKDDFLLNLAVDGKADYLITGDKDLLVLKIIEKTKILTYSEFINEMGNR